MNDIKSHVVFRADFPDDSAETNGEVVSPAGRNIMKEIGRSIASAGIKLTEPKQHSFYGWTAEFQIGKATIWLLLQQPGPWLLIAEVRAPWLASAKTKSDALCQGIALVANALNADARFVEPQWMTKESFQTRKRRGV